VSERWEREEHEFRRTAWPEPTRRYLRSRRSRLWALLVWLICALGLGLGWALVVYVAARR
jgi:hypothetical protein